MPALYDLDKSSRARGIRKGNLRARMGKAVAEFIRLAQMIANGHAPACAHPCGFRKDPASPHVYGGTEGGWLVWGGGGAETDSYSSLRMRLTPMVTRSPLTWTRSLT